MFIYFYILVVLIDLIMGALMKRNVIQNIYKELREKFIVIGLTGATGSGCTKSAEILSSELTEDDLTKLIHQSKKDNGCGDEIIKKYDSLEPYRAKKIYNFLKEEQWKPFYHIRVSNLLFALLFAEKEESSLKEDYQLDKWLKDVDGNDYKFPAIQKLCHSICSIILNKDNRGESLKKYLDKLHIVIDKTVNKKSAEYTTTFQKVGNELRKIGLKEYIQLSDEKNLGIFTISSFIKNTIKCLRDEDIHFFVIDALRNIYEINYFKARYSNFYLFSINAEETIRKKRLLNLFSYTESAYQRMSDMEKNKDNEYSQNINDCISNGDVFVTNNTQIEKLKYQLVKYISLIRKPGLFTPTKDERNMQIALTARYNSGCISRQVGACLVGQDGYILGVGWNDVPEKAVPCLYRSSYSLVMENNNSSEFSAYENSSQFKDFIREEVGITHDPFCFKDQENNRHKNIEIGPQIEFIRRSCPDIDDESLTKFRKKLAKISKNPTRERALHAEENAFLQSAKIGGTSVKGSTLYTTASPCQLCAKKAMQLGVKKIIFIDAYPDISTQQTLCSGPKDEWPELTSFYGAAESAFMKLYKPLINIKDEVEATY